MEALIQVLIRIPTRVRPSCFPSQSQRAPGIRLLIRRLLVFEQRARWLQLAQIKPHLRLLRASNLGFQGKVEVWYSDQEVADIVPPIARSVTTKERWVRFLEVAVERFVSVCSLCTGWLQIPTVVSIPPIDASEELFTMPVRMYGSFGTFTC